MLHQRKRGGAAASHIIRYEPGGLLVWSWSWVVVVGVELRTMAAVLSEPPGRRGCCHGCKKTTGGRWSFLVVGGVGVKQERRRAVMEAARRVLCRPEQRRPSGRGRGCCSHPEALRAW